MGDQHLDYHVGLLRGFVLAHNAPTAILHALDVLLTDYRSKAGDVIGAAPKPNRTELILPDMGSIKIPKLSEEAKETIKDTIEEKHFFWTPAEDKLLEDLCKAGKKPREIHKAFPNRTKRSIVNRIMNRKLRKSLLEES